MRSNRSRKSTSFLALLLSAVMLLGMIPMSVSADAGEITEISATVTAPTVEQTLAEFMSSPTIVTGSPDYTADYWRWYIGGTPSSPGIRMKDDDIFLAGYTYIAHINFNPADSGKKFDPNVTCRINDNNNPYRTGAFMDDLVQCRVAFTMEGEAQKYNINITGGVARENKIDGSIITQSRAGDDINITADDKPGFIFDKWEITPKVDFFYGCSAYTKTNCRLTMPFEDVTITAVYKQAITTATATVIVPVEGETCASAATVPVGADYTATVGGWCVGGTVSAPGPMPGPGLVFQAGQTYIAEVEFTPSSDKTFDEDNTIVTINGQTGYLSSRNTLTGTFCYCVAFTAKSKIQTIDITDITSPVDHETASYAWSIPSGAGYTKAQLDGADFWWLELDNDTTISSTDALMEEYLGSYVITEGAFTFNKDKYYVLAVSVNAKEGYVFANDASATVNGNAAAIIQGDGSLNEGDYIILYKFGKPQAHAHDPEGAWMTDGAQHWHICSICGDKVDLGNHEGGTATRFEQAICSVCNEKYGELATENIVVPASLLDGFTFTMPSIADAPLTVNDINLPTLPLDEYTVTVFDISKCVGSSTFYFDAFELGMKYAITVHLTAKEGYIFDSTSLAGLRFNGNAPTNSYIRGDGGLVATYEFTMPSATVSGTLQGFEGGSGDITVKLMLSGGTVAKYTETVAGNAGSYSITNVAGGEYTMVVTAADHITERYTVTVDDTAIEQNIVLRYAKITHRSNSVSFDDEISINKYVTVAGFEGIDIAAKGGMLIWNSAVTEAEAVYGTEDILKSGLLLADAKTGKYGQKTNGIAAKKYADELYLRVYVEVAEGEFVYGALQEYSVQDYCEAILNNGTFGKNMNDTCVALLYYGTASQRYFNYNLGDLANANIAATYSNTEWNDSMITALVSPNTDIVGTGDLNNSAKSISMDGVMNANFYFKPADEQSFTIISGELQVWSHVDGELSETNISYMIPLTDLTTRWGAQCEGVVAKELGTTFYVRAVVNGSDGNVHSTDVIPFSAEEYARQVLLKITDEKTVDLVKTMVIYGDCALKYFTYK